MSSILLLLAGLTAAQGQALKLDVADRPGVGAVGVEWAGHTVPCVKGAHGWWTVIGIDLDRPPGRDAATVSYRFGDGHVETDALEVVVEPKTFPTTELSVEQRYVELSPEDQSRAAREAAEIEGIYATVTEPALWSRPFIVPVDGVTGGRNFGHRRVFNGQPRAPHSGADLRADTGTPIHAANTGRVVLAKNLFFSGNAVFVDHGLGVYTVYLHLSKIYVEPGQIVERGQVVGLAGATGRVTGPHLHWGVHMVDARVDPFSLIGLDWD
jgi:murein DD-endopeptidase MepM/ murein hydrolase activator NlpD